MSTYSNDTFANCFAIPSKWLALFRLDYKESMWIISKQVSHEEITRWKPPSILAWTTILTVVLQEFENSYVFYYLDTENHQTLADNELFDKYSEVQCYQLIVYCDWNVKLHDLNLIFVLKR